MYLGRYRRYYLHRVELRKYVTLELETLDWGGKGGGDIERALKKDASLALMLSAPSSASAAEDMTDLMI